MTAAPEPTKNMEAAISQFELQAARQVWENLSEADRATLLALANHTLARADETELRHRDTGAPYPENADSTDAGLQKEWREDKWQAVPAPKMGVVTDLGLVKWAWVDQIIKAGSGWPPAQRDIACPPGRGHLLTGFGSIVARYGDAVTIVEKSKAKLPVTP